MQNISFNRGAIHIYQKSAWRLAVWSGFNDTQNVDGTATLAMFRNTRTKFAPTR